MATAKNLWYNSFQSIFPIKCSKTHPLSMKILQKLEVTLPRLYHVYGVPHSECIHCINKVIISSHGTLSPYTIRSHGNISPHE